MELQLPLLNSAVSALSVGRKSMPSIVFFFVDFENLATREESKSCDRKLELLDSDIAIYRSPWGGWSRSALSWIQSHSGRN
ncbi:hypothetical protein SLA2020_038810 [Shorea laevis]